MYIVTTHNYYDIIGMCDFFGLFYMVGMSIVKRIVFCD